jgi:hypothetical protein
VHAVGPGFDPITYEVRGAYIDVPLQAVDFLEVMTLHITGVQIWFDFLNLGFKLVPTAGTDWPFGGVPGTVRNYVQLSEPLTTQRWFDALRQGRTFVTSGPMLEFTVNGEPMGANIIATSGDPVIIRASARLNPYLGRLAKLELIEQGGVIRSIVPANDASVIKLESRALPDHGTWFMVRAIAENPSVVAYSAPIYVCVDGQNHAKRTEISSIVARMKSQVSAILESDQLETTEAWEAQEAFTRNWLAQSGLLKERMEQADKVYDDLLMRSQSSPLSRMSCTARQDQGVAHH